LIGKLATHLKDYGFRRTVTKALYILMVRSKIVNDIADRKDHLNTLLDRKFQATVAYGPLKGFRFLPESWWSKPDRAAMLLGLYEQEILTEVLTASAQRDVFIDIGAADGYYGVGCVTQGRFDRSICFEISPKGQEVVRKTAVLNGASDRVSVFGKADAAVLTGLPATDLHSAVVLIDIEGAEFDFLDAPVITLLQNAVIFIELHEWQFDDGDARLAALERRVAPFFRIDRFTTGARDLSVFPELADMSDVDRWLICSEHRTRLPQWWKLTPL
jgi:hypothetical protein